MTRAARRAVLIACVAMAIVQTVEAQFSGPSFLQRGPQDIDRAVQWAAAVVHHQPGVRDAAVDEIARWDEQTVDNLVLEAWVLHTLVRNERAGVFATPDNWPGRRAELGYAKSDLDKLRAAAIHARRAGLDQNDLIVRALLLHTDIALLADVNGLLLRVNDGRPGGVDQQADHWRLARRLAEWIDRRSGRQPDVYLWYRASLASLAAHNQWNTRHADAAAALRPADAELLFQAGCTHEMLASARVQSSVADAKLPYDVTLLVRSTGEELAMAAPLLQRASELDPGHVDARIHYGRVLTLMDRAGAAVPGLQRAATDARDAVQRYYARLFLGGAFEALHRNDEARSAYEAAASLFPDAQSPQFGLSQVANRQGQRTAAVSALERALTRGSGSDPGGDPWWIYSQSPGRGSESLLAQARTRLAATHGGTRQ